MCDVCIRVVMYMSDQTPLTLIQVVLLLLFITTYTRVADSWSNGVCPVPASHLVGIIGVCYRGQLHVAEIQTQVLRLCHTYFLC